MHGFWKKCQWWKDSHNDWDGSGECRRYPPTTTGQHPRGGISSAFPKTEQHDWCGEHQPKEQTPTE